MPMSYASKPRIVIVGAGFGGLAVAAGLAARRRRAHGDRSPEPPPLPAAPVPGRDRRALAGGHRLAGAEPPAPAEKRARADGRGDGRRSRRARSSCWTAGPIAYDALVLATGATHGYFGRDEWAVHAPGLKTLDDATAIRRRLLLAFERAEMASNPEECARLLTIVIVGGGPTGVELAGAVAELARRALARDFRVIDPTRTRVLLVEAGPRVLANFPESLSALHGTRPRAPRRRGAARQARDALRRRRRAHRRRAICARARSSGRPAFAASPAAALARRAADRAGRVPVTAGLHAAGHPRTSASSATRRSRRIPTVRQQPGIAPVAKQQGAFVARAIAARIAGRAPPAAFRVSRPRAAGDHRARGRRDRLAAAAPLGLERLVDLGRGPRVLPREPAQPPHRRDAVAVGLPALRAGRAAHHRQERGASRGRVGSTRRASSSSEADRASSSRPVP